jgi:hypothetical protein
MSRIRFIDHRGTRILLLDYSRISDPREALATIAESRRIVAAEPKDASLLTLTLVTGSHFDSGVLKAIREMVEHNKPHVRAAAVVGLNGLMRVVYNTLVHLTGRNIKAFEDEEAARSYLVAQRAAARPT